MLKNAFALADLYRVTRRRTRSVLPGQGRSVGRVVCSAYTLW
jgi:hypothetical protein